MANERSIFFFIVFKFLLKISLLCAAKFMVKVSLLMPYILIKDGCTLKSMINSKN